MKKNRVLLLLRLLAAALFFTSVCLAFAGFSAFSPAVKAQLFPAIDRKAWMTVAAIVLPTLLFGRFYCSVVCPFGILQDIIAFISRRKSNVDKNRPVLRYAVAAFLFTSFFAGSTFLIGLFDPYSDFGRIAAFIKNPSYTTGGIILLAIIVFAVWKKRIFCTLVCPVGTLLGLCAKISLFKLRLSDKCVRCRKCVSICLSGCIEPNDQALDNERCVRCLRCISVCPTGAIGFKKETPAPRKTDLSRRSFLNSSLTTAAAVGAGIALTRRTARMDTPEEKRPICPPGATTAEEFASKCTNCQLCVAGCAGKVLCPRSKQYQTVHLEYGESFCLYDCHKCSSVCPTGALQPLSLTEKQHRRIGLAQFSKKKCIGCGLCADTCPRNAVSVIDVDGEDKAVLNPELCIGCGACVNACPLPEKAVHIAPVLIQTRAF